MLSSFMQKYHTITVNVIVVLPCWLVSIFFNRKKATVVLMVTAYYIQCIYNNIARKKLSTFIVNGNIKT